MRRRPSVAALLTLEERCQGPPSLERAPVAVERRQEVAQALVEWCLVKLHVLGARLPNDAAMNASGRVHAPTAISTSSRKMIAILNDHLTDNYAFGRRICLDFCSFHVHDDLCFSSAILMDYGLFGSTFAPIMQYVRRYYAN